ncbi:MAG: Hsp20/alpha crystallin family protein [Candidatus Riflebacteria bacterium]|nr:Hsp20/alpha crystallin family protein [Candidatus Riflebacteria bacterium]
MTIWNFLKEMEDLQTELGKLANASSFYGLPRTSFLPGLSPRMFPMINLSDAGDDILLEAMAPGLDPESLNVTALKNQITISGQKAALETERENIHRSERAAGKFTRTIELPLPVETDKIEASYANGILKVTLPKAEEAKPRQISIDVKN